MTVKETAYRYLIGSDVMKKEFWKELRVLIIFTLGFTIAFTWRQTVYDVVESTVQFFTHMQASATLSIATSTVTTIFCLLLLYITAKYMTRLYDRY
jgi:ABC-type spermidine/putrescine transport system permease subunit I